MSPALSSPALASGAKGAQSAALSVLVRIWLVWASVAVGIIALGLPRLLGPQIVPISAIGGVIVAATAALTSRTLDGYLRALGVRLIVAAHGLRFLGGFFIWAGPQGFFPARFAWSAGVGDVLTAAAGMMLLLISDPRRFRRWFLVWNAIGLLDLVHALGTGLSFNLTRPGSMDTMTTLPWALIPLLLVPWFLATHLKGFQWAASDEPLPGEARS